MMIQYNNKLCIEAKLLYEGDYKVTTRETCNKYIGRNPHVRARRGGGKNKTALLYWDLLRDDWKQGLVKNGFEVDEKEPCLKNRIEKDYSAVAFFANFTLPNGRYLTAEQQQVYCNNNDILTALKKLTNDSSALQKALGGKQNIWGNLTKEVKALKNSMKHSVPCSEYRLKEKVAEFVIGDYISLVKGNHMNTNAAAIKSDDQESTIRQLLRKHNNLDNEQIATLYNIVAEKLEWKSITSVTVDNYRKKFNLTTISARRGENYFDNYVGMQVKRQAPTYPLQYWTIDGWEAELLYQKSTIDSKGNSITTYHNRATVVVALDPVCKYPIGYAVGTQESSDLIKQALRNAIIHTKELFGEYYKVLQIQSDNYGKKILTPLYNIAADKYTPARVGNAKAKVIEPYFRKLNHDYCQLLPNWSGYGVKSKRQPNDQYLNKIRHSFPDYAGVVSQIDNIIAAERLRNREQYMQLFNEMPASERQTINIEELLYHFGDTTGFVNSLTGPGVVATIEGEKHYYDSFDIEFRNHSHESWSLRYLPGDTDRVLAVNAKGVNGKLAEEIGTLRFMLQDKHVQPMALSERQEDDTAELNKIRDFNKSLKEQILDEMEDDYNEVKQLFERKELEGTLTKLVLVDSVGQHKDNKSRKRIAESSKKLLAKAAKQEAKQEEQSWAARQEEYLRSRVNLEKYLQE